MKNTKAPEGYVWVCGACGKTARDVIDGGISQMWDESCFLHALLVKESDISVRSPGGRVTKIEKGAEVRHRRDVCQ